MLSSFNQTLCKIKKMEMEKEMGISSGTFSSATLFRSNWNLEMLVLRRGGNRMYSEKDLSEQGRQPTTKSTHIRRQFRDSHGATLLGGEGAHHCAIPAPIHLTCFVVFLFINFTIRGKKYQIEDYVSNWH